MGTDHSWHGRKCGEAGARNPWLSGEVPMAHAQPIAAGRHCSHFNHGSRAAADAAAAGYPILESILITSRRARPC
eukprot:364442-Chlamydomonas_euryale.AAC.8